MQSKNIHINFIKFATIESLNKDLNEEMFGRSSPPAGKCKSTVNSEAHHFAALCLSAHRLSMLSRCHASRRLR